MAGIRSLGILIMSAAIVLGQTAPRPAYEDRDAPRGKDWSRAGTLAAGTELVVRTIDRIDVSRADPKQRFNATVDNDIVDENGRVVIPRGSNAHLIANDVGHGEIAIDLRSVFVNGQRFILNAEDLTTGNRKPGVGENKRTGEYVGGGAVFGTILGAIAGGGKGAAIGALAGGAAGASAEMLTRGTRLKVPPEAILRPG